MRKRLFNVCILGAAMGMCLACAAPAATPESGPFKVKLVPAPLPAPELTISVGGAHQVYQGIVLPGSITRFSAGEESVSATIAGVPVAFLRSGAVFGMNSGGSPVVLQKAGIGYRSVAIKGKNGPYMVGFPYGMVYAPRLNKVVASVQRGKLAAADAAVSDKAQRVALGGPFVLSLSYRMNGDKLVVNPGTFRVAGQGGEEYQGVKYAAAEIGIVTGGGRAVRVGKMAFG